MDISKTMEILYKYYNSFKIEILLAIAILLFLLYLINVAKLNKLNKKYKAFMTALCTKNIEELFEEQIANVKLVIDKNNEILEDIKNVKNTLDGCVQKHAIVRYTAFDDVGSDLSFAIALLDAKDNGIVLNGVYSREGSSVYAKPIHNGESKYILSEEEKKSLENAKRKANASQ